ncbi:aspartate-semialdehyde dehydrogenase [Vulgatibacter incomptus]|uniref:aspartate-semialdehyde dehydrogenase n=1 Tax=Vulgatibacter incomptus TaxID=1391653 RepID=A0A0K1PDR0_9BACT|nr:aspartate-semialdehyde dehydrogenase [Vulgatibacter incomptus]AKU91551.1 Aspartate-semialdehyde dehydrogenase [Vulgatibacter incomptus]
MKRIPVAVIGATGLAGQQFLAALGRHPIFDLVAVAASSRSAGKAYRDAIRDEQGASRWFAGGPLPEAFGELIVEDASRLDPAGLGLVFSAVDGEQARELEARIARTTPVVSTASAFRYEDDVPLIVPPVNPDHVELLGIQQRRRGWKGFVAPIPNCTTTGLAITLAPLVRSFGVELALMTSMQAVSGAGRSPGVPALDVVDNVIPYIPKEEEKVASESRKILGTLEGEGIVPHPLAVSCTCTRVAVLDGHTESVFVRLERRASPESLIEALRGFASAPDVQGLPSAPPRWIEVSDDPFRPQPRLDRDAGDGMVTTVGRVREDPALGNGAKYVLVSHNTKMGAAKGAILLAELLHARGWV